MSPHTKRPLLVLVNGRSCTGKSTLSAKISDKFKLPLFGKDGIKESLFDSLGWSDRDWSRTLSGASFKLLDYILTSELRAGRSLILEGPFDPERDGARIGALVSENQARVLEIFCSASPKVLLERFKLRVESGARHPGHNDQQVLIELREKFARGDTLQPLRSGPELYEVDTTDFSALDYDRLYAAIESEIGS